MKSSNSIPRELMDSLMLSIVSFMNKAGMSPAEIEACFRTGLNDLSTKTRDRAASKVTSATSIGCDTIAGAVLRAWHRDPDYLDEFANPLALTMMGARKSLATLVKAQDAKADLRELVSAMHRTGLIKKVGAKTFLPTTTAATISQMHPFAVDHVVKTVLRLVETVTRNMRLVDSQHSLVERYAHIPDLDAKEARAFSEFSRQQGAACLEAIEDWLEARRKQGIARNGRQKNGSLSAGMHVFAYLEQPATSVKRGGTAKRRAATSSRAIPA